MSEGTGKSKLRISFVMVGISLVALVVTYASVTIAAAWRAREAIAEMRTELRAREMRWVAGIHLNTDNPHLHILISKEIKDLVTDKPRRMGRIPRSEERRVGKECKSRRSPAQ